MARDCLLWVFHPQNTPTLFLQLQLPVSPIRDRAFPPSRLSVRDHLPTCSHANSAAGIIGCNAPHVWVARKWNVCCRPPTLLSPYLPENRWAGLTLGLANNSSMVGFHQLAGVYISTFQSGPNEVRTTPAPLRSRVHPKKILRSYTSTLLLQPGPLQMIVDAPCHRRCDMPAGSMQG